MLMESSRQVGKVFLRQNNRTQSVDERRVIPRCLARKAGWIVLPFTEMRLTLELLAWGEIKG